jgi:hypothetical protein
VNEALAGFDDDSDADDDADECGWISGDEMWSWIRNKQTVKLMGRIWLRRTNGNIFDVS